MQNKMNVLNHANLSFFIPHLGCPHKCSFCDQKSISGQIKRPEIDEVEQTIKQHIERFGFEGSRTTQIAFFGGSFTAIERSYMISLLEVAKKYINAGYFSGIRISTRPDCINDEILNILKKYSVTAIELGCQSTDDTVLELNNRGHNFFDIHFASQLIKEYDFELGLQMMVGLYGDTISKSLKTADDIIMLRPSTVRIYPTVVIENTHLSQLLKNGDYKLIDFDDVVDLCADLLVKFNYANINVIKLGLHASETLETNIVGGFYHPAFRELCESRIYLKKITKIIGDIPKGNVLIGVAKGCLSKAIGQKKANVIFLAKQGYNVKFKECDNMKQYDIVII